MTFVVAIDGPAGTGKGTITQLVGNKLNLINIDTGATYRCVTLEMIRKGIHIDEEDKILKILDTIKIDFKKENGKELVFLNDEDVTSEIRNKEVNELVSQVSHIPIVRNNMANFQRKLAEGKRVIMEGRDIGTNVFPNADVKIYLDATAEERANRRLKQNKEQGIDIPYEEILENIKFRDNNDKTSTVAPLKQAEDAVYIDTTNMTIEQVENRVIEIINEKQTKKEPKLTKKEERIQKKIQRRYSYKDTKWKLFKRKIVKAVILAFYKIVYRIEVVGEKIPDEGAYIICGNHVSFFDPPAVVTTSKRHINMVAKEDLLRSSILYWLGSTFNVIPIKRDSQDIDSMKRCLEILKNNEILGIYPEGTRNGLKKNNGKVKNGAAFFVARTGVPVIPVGIKGSFKPFTKVTLNYGKPLDFSQYQTKKPDKETLDKISEEIMDNIIKLTK